MSSPTDVLFEPSQYLVGGVAIGISALSLCAAAILIVIVMIGTKNMN